ncbi:hypothetical protein RRX38_02720 [Pseudomonas sp. DTU_2021_1001937_2_SI_NGA_ILE_001]|uniref:hypothetical protein n=1 Tax=Pseudomonas sp. DTU_2021_1001937_2_SI_NGA_ILE_001 TaxID=3077589 RepID=UPI0028FC1186|nr:hypothetical protein [Pseudomonas sp. DTU_2021_1001937_2_SI_NGA_ILE_001]WNW10104.1 hypothetical protein RRX38_02720 [Pseudomonas sp. DTU_2021_1001937_2_SI_NGA_ILE_001]
MAKKATVSEFINSTVGLLCNHDAYACPVLVKAEANTMSDGTVRLSAVNGHTLGDMTKAAHVFLTQQQWNERPCDPYDDTAKAVWALRHLGFRVSGLDPEPEA